LITHGLLTLSLNNSGIRLRDGHHVSEDFGLPDWPWRREAARGISDAPEVFKPFLAEFGVSGGVLDCAMGKTIR
jgi:hypothetical protein